MGRGFVLAAVVGAVVFAAAVLSPLRSPGGDTLPGRLGAMVSVCAGGQDLMRVDWLRDRVLTQRRIPYYAVASADGQRLVSTFGPSAAWTGAFAFMDVAPGSALHSDAVLTRARFAAACCVALAAALLALAGYVRRGPWGAAAGLAAGLSFAGVASLSQGLWQQTAALPWLAAAVLVVALSFEHGAVLLALPALLAAMVWSRPADLFVALGLFVAAAMVPAARTLSRSQLALAVAGAVLASAPWALWHLTELGTINPLAAQWKVNTHVSKQTLSFAPGTALPALAALLVSPGKGLLFFAPAAVAAPFVARSPWSRALLGGVLLELLLSAAFARWWGGLCFGPRLLSLTTWVLLWVAFVEAQSSRAQIAVATFAVLGAVVGLMGAWRYDARTWDLPAEVDGHPENVWYVSPSPWTALFVTAEGGSLQDSPRGTYRCEGGRLGFTPDPTP